MSVRLEPGQRRTLLYNSLFFIALTFFIDIVISVEIYKPRFSLIQLL